jgi:long-chain acyl-CoA synthetase
MSDHVDHGHTPTDVLDWLRRARTGGVHRVERPGTIFTPWSDVLTDVEKVAAHLQASGVQADARVGIRGDNSYSWLVLDLALLQIGAIPVAVPIPDFKGQTNADIAQRYGLVAMFAAKTSRDREFDAVPLESLLELPPVTVRTPPHETRERYPRTGPGYYSLAFSSGTAGRVKCLLMSWPGTRKLIEATSEAYPLTPDDRIMIALPLATYQQRYLCYLAIYNQCDIVLTTVARYLATLTVARPTFLLGPPNFYEFALTRFRNEPLPRRTARLWASRLAAPLPNGLRDRWRRWLFRKYHQMFGGNARRMLVGSAPVPAGMLEFFTLAGFGLHQVYGMTESGFLTWNRPGANRIGSVGQETYPGSVLISDDSEVLIKHPWHICVGYEGEESAEAAKVFGGDNVIATGDLGYLDDGYLFLKGRKKNVIVTAGGQKVQVEDLEADLGQAAGINQVALVPPPDGDGLAVVAWYRGDEAAVREALRPRVRHVNLRLPADLKIRRLGLIEGELSQDSPLLNRNLKLNREAVRTATASRLDSIDW